MGEEKCLGRGRLKTALSKRQRMDLGMEGTSFRWEHSKFISGARQGCQDLQTLRVGKCSIESLWRFCFGCFHFLSEVESKVNIQVGGSGGAV